MRLAVASGLSLLLLAGPAAAQMGGHGGGMGHGGGFGHGGGGFSHGGGGFMHGAPPGGMHHDGVSHGADGRAFHGHRFHDGVAIVPFGFGYYAPYAGYYPYPPTAYDTYCNQLSSYYDPYVCWDYYGYGG
jgi:hypothetical protein